MQLRGTVLALMILAMVLARLIPHPPNFAPILAAAVFGGATLNSRWAACLIPLSAKVLSDLIIGFDGSQLWVYGALVATVFLSHALIQNRAWGRIVATTLLCSFLFFIVTNFGVWLGSGMYPHTVGGFVTCFVVAVPFFGNTLAGDLLFTSIAFFVLNRFELRFPALRPKIIC